MGNTAGENRKVVARIVKKAAPEPSTVAVFLVCGQSNTEGRIPNSDLPAYLATNGRAQGDRTLEAGKAFFSITEGDEHARQSKLRFAIPAKLSSQVLPFAPQEEFSPQYALTATRGRSPRPICLI